MHLSIYMYTYSSSHWILQVEKHSSHAKPLSSQPALPRP